MLTCADGDSGHSAYIYDDLSKELPFTVLYDLILNTAMPILSSDPTYYTQLYEQTVL